MFSTMVEDKFNFLTKYIPEENLELEMRIPKHLQDLVSIRFSKHLRKENQERIYRYKNITNGASIRFNMNDPPQLKQRLLKVEDMFFFSYEKYITSSAPLPPEETSRTIRYDLFETPYSIIERRIGGSTEIEKKKGVNIREWIWELQTTLCPLIFRLISPVSSPISITKRVPKAIDISYQDIFQLGKEIENLWVTPKVDGYSCIRKNSYAFVNQYQFVLQQEWEGEEEEEGEMLEDGRFFSYYPETSSKPFLKATRENVEHLLSNLHSFDFPTDGLIITDNTTYCFKWKPLDKMSIDMLDNGSVVEYVWNTEKNEFERNRFRFDRNGKPNSTFTIQRVQERIRRPVNLLGGYIQVQHTIFKKTLLEMIQNNKKRKIQSFMDVGSGRGADVLKWKKYILPIVDSLICFEPYPDSIVELKDRIEKSGLSSSSIEIHNEKYTESTTQVADCIAFFHCLDGFQAWSRKKKNWKCKYLLMIYMVDNDQEEDFLQFTENGNRRIFHLSPDMPPFEEPRLREQEDILDVLKGRKYKIEYYVKGNLDDIPWASQEEKHKATFFRALLASK